MKIVTTALILAAVVIICCTAMPKKRFCSRKPKTGPCRGAFERYFYNTTSERCETFTYGGCKGNKNRFTSFLRCMQTCHKCEVKGAEYSSCDSICRNTCESPNNTLFCRAPCRYGCACPRNLVLDRKNQRCIPVKDCPPKCPIKGQIVYRCAPCDGTCDRPLVPCPRICRAGCACPRGEVINPARKKCVPLKKCPPRCKYNGQYYKPGQTFNSTDGCNICTCSKNGNVSCTERACIPESCPVPGQVYSNCSSPCIFTCANVDRISCIALCVKGCGCPGGQVIDEDKNKCVPISECPGREPECPIEGQIYYGGDRCAPCDGTCDQPLVPCPLICRRGCGCPRGQVIDRDRKRCVALSDCPPRCPIKGQRYFNASKGECVPCTGTCEDTNPVCTRECRSGCGCPNGTVLDKDNNRCIHPRTCPRECEYEGEVYQPGDRWDCSDSGKCMKCWCLANGVVVNHTLGCPKRMCVLKNGTKVPDGTYYRRNPCEHCTCINGTFRCAVQDCARPPCINPYRPPGACCPICPPGCRYNGHFYKPGATFNSSDGCNTCTCSLLASTVSCTKRACRPKMICPRPLSPGVCAELCSSDDDCELDEKCCSNGCGHQCTKGTLCAAVFCLRPSCPLNNIIPPGPDECCGTCGCRYGGKLYRSGETFSTIDGCNNCTCSTGGRTLCTKKACKIPKCPIEGQIYYGGRHCAPCDGTCDQPLVPCPRICRRGCACPIGEVIDRAQNRCVALSECPPLKPVCPKPTGPGTCVERCSRDEDCFAGQKCCSNGCGHVCTTIQNCAAISCAVPKCDFPTGVVIAPPAGLCCPRCGCNIGGGKVLRIGQSYKSGCNGCSCTMRGPICTLIACPPAPPGSK